MFTEQTLLVLKRNSLLHKLYSSCTTPIKKGGSFSVTIILVWVFQCCTLNYEKKRLTEINCRHFRHLNIS